MNLANISLILRGAIRSIKRFISEKSFLSLYLFVMAEGLSKKIRRLYLDPSDIQSHLQQLKYKKQLRLFDIGNIALHSLQDQKMSIHHKCLNPCSLYLMPWYLIVFIGNFYIFVQMTIMIGIGPQAWQTELATNTLIIIDCILISVLIGDIIAKFNIGFINNGVIVTNKQRVISRYKRILVFTDSTLVIILILSLVNKSYYWNYFKIIVIFKFVRILEIDTIMMRILAVHSFLKVLFVMFKQIITILIYAHIIGVFYFMIDNYLLTTSVCSGENSKFCWLQNATAYSPISSLPWQVQYFYCFYWGMNTITNINYGDIAPQNPYQTIYMFLVFMISLVLCGYIINQIVIVLFQSVVTKQQYRAQLEIYTTFLKNLHINQQHEQQIKQHLQQKYKRKQQQFNIDRLLSKFSEQLKNEYYQNAYRYINQGLLHFFRNNCSSVRLLSALQEKHFGSGEEVNKQGILLKGLNYLHQGILKYICMYQNKQYQINKVNNDSTFFLSYQFFTKERTTFSVVADSNSVIYFIPQSAFEQQRTENGDFNEIFCLLRYELTCQKIINRVFYSCFYCSQEHLWFECSLYFVNLRQDKDKLMTQLVQQRGNRTVSQLANLQQSGRSLLLNSMIKKYKEAYLEKIQLRLLKLIHLREKKVRLLEVDRVYEWPAYLTHFNISTVREKWNGRGKQLRYTNS